MGRGPARPINFSEGGRRPGPVPYIFKFSMPGPQDFQMYMSAPPGPAHVIGGAAYETRALHGPVHALSRTKTWKHVR